MCLANNQALNITPIDNVTGKASGALVPVCTGSTSYFPDFTGTGWGFYNAATSTGEDDGFHRQDASSYRIMLLNDPASGTGGTRRIGCGDNLGPVSATTNTWNVITDFTDTAGCKSASLVGGTWVAN